MFPMAFKVFFLLRIFPIILTRFFKAVLLNSSNNKWLCVILTVTKHHSGFISKLFCESSFLLLGIAQFGSAEPEPLLGVCLPWPHSSAAPCVPAARKGEWAAGGRGAAQRGVCHGRTGMAADEFPGSRKFGLHQLQHWLRAAVSLSTKRALLCSVALPGPMCPPTHLVPVHPMCSGQVAATSIKKSSTGDGCHD